MKTNHTPGPWEVEHERNKFDSACDTLSIISPAMDHTHGGRQLSVPRIVLATVNVRAFAPHMAEPEANARLMAAAPDLLAVIIKAESFLRNVFSGNSGACHHAAEMRAAIIKATTPQ